MKFTVLFLLSFYKKFLSPVLVSFFGNSCKFNPSCSEYSYQAVQKFGVLRGGIMSIKRLVRCNPFSKGGFDPVGYSA